MFKFGSISGVLKGITLANKVVLLFCLVGCASEYQRTQETNPILPEGWQTEVKTEAARWTNFVKAPELENLLEQAISTNPGLRQKLLDLRIAESTLFQKKMQYWPSLNLGLTGTRSGIENTAQSTSNSISFSANMSYELNLYGQLSDEKKAAGFSYSAATAEYERAKRSLVADVSAAWLEVIENQKLVTLRSARLGSLEKNLAIIEAGYRSGLNVALEVYLARNDVESERSRLIQQELSLSDSRRTLSRLLGHYPNNLIETKTEFPATNLVTAPNLPSELLTGRPDIRFAWFNVLQKNSTLAVAHKARFPSLSLSASAGKSSSSFSDLSGSNVAWSLGASLIQPLINSGRLKSAEDIARLGLEQSEQAYLETVYLAFQEVESGLEKQVKLEDQLLYTKNSAGNAIQAEKLAFDQYQRGIVSYSTVLESQRRSLDAQIQLISLSKQIIVNKVNLLNAVNGELDF